MSDFEKDCAISRLKPEVHSSWEYTDYMDLKDLKKIRADARKKLVAAKKKEKERQKLIKEREKVKRQTALLAGYQGKARRAAKWIKNQLEQSDTCPYCEEPLGQNPHADHIYPISMGGQSVPDNIVLVCEACNLRKKDLSLRQFIREYNLNQVEIEKRLEALGKYF